MQVILKALEDHLAVISLLMQHGADPSMEVIIMILQ